MEEFLVHFEITIPPGADPQEIARLYNEELDAAKPLFDGGYFRRVWREPGTLNHWALWYAPDADFVHLAYASFPLFKAGYGRATIHPLAINSNDPGWQSGDRWVPDEFEALNMRIKLQGLQGPATPPEMAA